MFAVQKHKNVLMEIQKVIRIVALFILVAAFAVRIASKLLFPDASHMGDFPISIVLLLCVYMIWNDTRDTEKQRNHSNE